MEAAVDTSKSKRRGILYILSAAFFFSLMTLFIRMSGDLPTVQKTLFRNLFAGIVAWIMLLTSKEKIVIGKENLPALIKRSTYGVLGMLCNFYAIDHLNLADANILNKLSPFFAILMSYFILKEKATKKEWLIVLLAFVGALFVIRPGFSMSAGPAFIGALGGFGAGVAYTYVRKLGTNGVRGPIIVMFFSTFSTLFCLPFLIFMYEPMSTKQWFILIAAGLCAAGGQLSITAAYTHAPAKEISIYDYMQVIFASVWGFMFFGQIPDFICIIGYVIILTAAVLRWMEAKKN